MASRRDTSYPIDRNIARIQYSSSKQAEEQRLSTSDTRQPTSVGKTVWTTYGHLQRLTAQVLHRFTALQLQIDVQRRWYCASAVVFSIRPVEDTARIARAGQ